MHDDGTSPDAGAGPSHAAARILERIADAYIVLDAGFRFVEVNPAAERSMRRSKAELLGRSHREVFPASHDILAGVDYQRAARERVELHLTQHYRDEGRDIHLEIDVYPDDDRVTVLWRDVTARVQTEQALHASEVRLRAVLDAVPVGVFVADANGRLAIINAQAAEIVGGAPPAERIADYAQYRGYWTDSGVELRAEDWALARALRTGERIAGERIELMRLDGGRRSVLNHAAPIHDATGQLLGGVAATVDVTAQVAAEAARQTELAERAAWFRSVFEQAPMAVVVGRGRSIEALVFELVNPRWAEMLPPKREFVGRPVDEAFPELAPEVRAVLAQVLATGEPVVLDGLCQPLDRDGDGVPEDYYFNFAFHPLRTADGTVEGLVAVGAEITEAVRARREAEALSAELRASEERYALAARATRNAIWEWDLVSDAHAWAEGGPEVFGYEPGALPPGIDWWYDHIHPEDRSPVTASVRAVIDGAGDGHAWRGEYRFRRGDGSWAHVVDRGYVVRDGAGRPLRMIGALEDVTAQRQLEERLRQAQKMEAVGQLAGGVAHDFNNLLTVISGNLEFLRDDLTGALPPDHPTRQDVAEIAQAAERARALVRQLLTFSRKQAVRLQPLDLRDVVRGAESLLRRVIGEEIQLAVELDDAPASLEADPGQLEQVLMNLAVNARDAMRTALHGHDGRGGTLTLGVDVVTLGAAETRRWDDVRPGRWVRLRVRDTGHGMDAETQQHVFEPFFTTKAVGQGTGLGLATVHGIVRQAGGAIRVESVPGRHTTFTILFPAAGVAAGGGEAGDASAGGADASSGATRGGRPGPTGTILLVEDEAPVRAVVRRTLERRGLPVLAARHGADALMIWRRHADAIRAVVTDLRMPELGGRELIAQLRAERPTLPVVYLSGYAEDPPDAQDGARTAFVAKPFTMEGLLAALDGVLGAAQD